MGLLAVGLLMVTVTPRRAESPIAISASTTALPDSPGARRAAVPAPTGSEVRALRSEPAEVLATPIGDGTFALVTRASLRNSGASVIQVRLPSGRRSAGSIVTASGDAVVVALATAETGHPVATSRPEHDDMVTVMAEPPITIAFDEVDSLAVDEGTAVIDDDGHLVGICSRRERADGVRVIEVSAELDAATSVVP